jgi:hypothetical protein
MNTEYIFDARRIIEIIEKEGSMLDQNAKRDLYLMEKVVHEKDPKRYDLLQIFFSWMTDGNEKSIMPEIVDSDGQLKDIDYEIFNIFREDEWEPEDFVNKFIPELEVTYGKYFKIFDHPLFTSPGNDVIRYNRIICPIGFKQRFYKLIEESGLYDQRHVIFHLIAEIIEFKRKYIPEWFDEEGVKYLKEIRAELNLLEELKFNLHSNPRLIYEIREVNLIFESEPFPFKTQWVIWYYILDRILQESKNMKYANKPSKIKQLRLPSQNNYLNYMQDLLINSLYHFLVNETKFQFDEKKQPRKLVDFFISFFDLCGIPLLTESKQFIKSQDKRFEKVERKIERALKKQYL